MPSEHETESQILEALAVAVVSRDRAAFRELVDRTHKTIYRLAFRILGTKDEAEDVVQETFVRLWTGSCDIKEPSKVLSWICRVARNASFDRLRSRKRKAAESLDRPVGEGLSPLKDLLDAKEGNPEEMVAAQQLSFAVESALAGLKEKHRLVLMLREVDEMSYEEIGEALGISIGTVESRIHRARKALARRLKGLVGELKKED